MTDLVEAITSAAAAVPDRVKSNIFQAMGRLIGAAVEVPAAYLEGKAQGFRDDAAGRTLVSKAAAEAAAARIREDPALAGRAVDHYAERMLREQRNRENVAALAIAELAANPPDNADAKAVTDDWLDMFARLAEGRSDADVQAHFGKLLAEEIRAPGSFAPATMQVLSLLTPATAKLFQNLCAITATFDAVEGFACVLCAPFGLPGQNSLQPFGLSYLDLNVLNTVGLVHGDWTAWRELPRIVFRLGVRVANTRILEAQPISAPPSEHMLKSVRSGVVNLTPTGLELRRIVHATPHPDYVQGLSAWIAAEVKET